MREAWRRCLGTAVSLLALTLGTAAEPQVSAANVEQGPGRHIAPGLTYFTQTIGDSDASRQWTVAVLVPAAEGEDERRLGSQNAARGLAEEVRQAGFPARVEAVHWPRSTDGPQEVLGWRVRSGFPPSRRAAERDAARLNQAGFAAEAHWRSQDHDAPAGPTQVHVVVVDTALFTGKLTGSYGAALGAAETTSSMAEEDALVAVNAGYFTVRDAFGIPGAPTGLTFINGTLLSEAAEGRSALVLEEGGARQRVAHLATRLTVRAEDSAREIDGINRRAGTIRNCGGVGGDLPTGRPRHDATCTDPDEVVLLTPELGVDTHEVDGVEAVVDDAGRVRKLRDPGGPVPAGTRVLQGIGEGADWLIAHAPAGAELGIDKEVIDTETGLAVRPGPHDTILNGGPRLLRDGEVALDVVADGTAHPDDPSFLYTWGMMRHPRQLVGLGEDDRVFVVTVDGRQPGHSAGFGLGEAAEFLRSLGAVEGMALDGGGSATMVIEGTVVNSPSDPHGERAVGDALLLLPES